MWIDLKGVKRQVTMEMLLSYYGVNLRRVNTTYIRGECPLPCHSSKDSKYSFTVNLEKNIWSCKSDSCIQASGRKGGNVLDFVAVMERCTIVEAAKRVMERYPVRTEEPKKPTAPAKAEAVQGAIAKRSTSSENGKAGASEENRPLAFELRGISYHPYLEQRGISKETAEKFGVGFFPGQGSMFGRVVIPIRNEKSELVAYAGRALDDAVDPKYKLPAGFHKAKVLFNYHSAKEKSGVFVAEGMFGCMYLSQAGFNAVALMGCTMSETQEAFLSGFTGVCLVLDGDEPGRRATRDILDRLSKRTYVKAVYLPDGLQPDALPIPELKSIL